MTPQLWYYPYSRASASSDWAQLRGKQSTGIKGENRLRIRDERELFGGAESAIRVLRLRQTGGKVVVSSMQWNFHSGICSRANERGLLYACMSVIALGLRRRNPLWRRAQRKNRRDKRTVVA
jgi:hypothetical protein